MITILYVASLSFCGGVLFMVFIVGSRSDER